MNMMQSNQLMEDELESMNDGNNRSDNKNYNMYDRNVENSSGLSY